MKLLRAVILLGSLIMLARAQRPLNITTNVAPVRVEPFFVKPERRDGGGTYQPDATGIRNRERLTPPHSSSHLDMFNPPLNSLGGPQSGQGSQANRRLHKPQPSNKVLLVHELLKSGNMTKTFERKTVRRPEAYISTGPHDEQEKSSNGPSSEGKSIKALQKMRDDRIDQHTPSPPPVNMDDIDVDEKLGVKCSFEKPCAWTFDTNVTGPNFEVTTGVLLKESNVTGLLHNFSFLRSCQSFLILGVTPGPQADHNKDANGHFLHVRLMPETTTRILKSPVFSSTREKCYLEAFLHQSSMLKGSIKIVIEPVGSRDNSWVPAEIMGDDLRKWKFHTFEIDR